MVVPMIGCTYKGCIAINVDPFFGAIACIRDGTVAFLCDLTNGGC